MGHPDGPKRKRLYLVDLGLTQRYADADGDHHPYCQRPSDFRQALYTKRRNAMKI